MTPDHFDAACHASCRIFAQRGVSLLSAIFMLLLFGALAAYMASFTGAAHVTSAQDVQGSRAYFAAEAGLEWGLYRVMKDGASCAGVAGDLPAPLGDFTVTVSCTETGSFDEGEASFKIYRLTSRARITGVSVGTPAFVEREVVATLTR